MLWTGEPRGATPCPRIGPSMLGATEAQGWGARRPGARSRVGAGSLNYREKGK